MWASDQMLEVKDCVFFYQPPKTFLTIVYCIFISVRNQYEAQSFFSVTYFLFHTIFLKLLKRGIEQMGLQG